MAVAHPPLGLAATGWVALLPLLRALDGASTRSRLWYGWVAGTCGALGVTGPWMFHAARDYFEMSVAIAGLFTFLVNQLFVSSYFMAFGLASGWVRRPALRVLYLPLLFTAVEYARATVGVGNPWAQLGATQTWPVLMQVADLGGVYGLTLLLAMSASALDGLRRSPSSLLATMLLTAAVVAYGYRCLDAPRGLPTQPVALVQAALPNSERGRPRFFARHWQVYVEQTAALVAPPGTLVVWPENAVGFFPEDNPELLEPLREILVLRGWRLLFGAPRAATRPGADAALFNSVFLLDGAGLHPVYDKRALLPFVERGFLDASAGPYVAGVGDGAIAAGLAVAICFEAIYPSLVAPAVRAGADLLINLSNDSWFEAGAGPEQHYQAARWRTVENRISLVRVTNSGISAVVDSYGREIARLTPGRAEAVLVQVPRGRGESIYLRFGDWFVALCVLVAVALIAIDRRRHS